MPDQPLLPAVPDEKAFEALRGDALPWLPAIRTICARHGLSAEQAFAERTGSNVVFQVERGPWIKLFPPLWPGDHLRERTGLLAARAVEGLAIPQLLHEGEVEGWPYVVLSHIPGRPIGLVWPSLVETVRVDLARQLGALLKRFHTEVEVASCAPIHEDWPAYARALRTDAVARQASYGLDPAWVSDLERFVAALPPMDAGRPVVLHADVTDQHVFIQEDGGRWSVTGLIDFGDTMIGDAEYEFAAPLVFLTQGQPAVQRALLEGYGHPSASLTPGLGRRLAAWALLHRWGRIPSYGRFAAGPPARHLDDLVASIWTPA